MRTSFSKAHFTRAFRIWPGLAVAWFVVPLAVSRLVGIREGVPNAYDLVGALLVSVDTSLIMAFLETRPLSREANKRFFGGDLIGRTLIYTVIVCAAVVISFFLLPVLFPGEYPASEDIDFSELLTTPVVWAYVLGLLLASLAINFLLHLRLVVGSKHLLALFTGRYREPIEERRVFVFVDLIGSTGIAQALGPLEFAHFKHDFFCDVTDVVAHLDGQIIQYVGDEVMLSWSVASAARRGAPLLLSAEAAAVLDSREAYYQRRYGQLPRFRTGIHAGTVVVAQLGDQRRDIVYSGDVVNTAARLLQACRPQGVDLLISAEALALMPAEVSAGFVHVGDLELRGRAATLAVCGREVTQLT